MSLLMFNVRFYKWLNRVELAAVLEPGEKLLSVGGFHNTWNGDESRFELEDHELPKSERDYLAKHGRRMPTSDNFVQDVDWQGIHGNPDRINRFLSGSAGSGAPSSVAGKLWRLSKDKGSLGIWAVTDRRFLIWDERAFKQPRAFEILFEVSRDQIASVRQPLFPLFSWTYIQIAFTDGSMIGFNAAIVDFLGAGQLRRTLRNAPRTRGGRP